MKKRSVEAGAFHDTALRVALGASSKGNAARVVAVARTGEAAPRLITESEWAAFCKQFDSNVMTLSALQVYVHPAGGVGTVYRNEYSVTNQQGKVVTGTTKHAYAQVSFTRTYVCVCVCVSCVLTCVCVARYAMYKHADGSAGVGPEPVRSRDMRLNEQLDATTRRIVRFVEATSRCRIVHVNVEYVSLLRS